MTKEKEQRIEDRVVPDVIKLELEDTSNGSGVPSPSSGERVYHMGIVAPGKDRLIVRFISAPKGSKIKLDVDYPLHREVYDEIKLRTPSDSDLENDPDLSDRQKSTKWRTTLRVYNHGKAEDIIPE